MAFLSGAGQSGPAGQEATRIGVSECGLRPRATPGCGNCSRSSRWPTPGFWPWPCGGRARAAASLLLTRLLTKLLFATKIYDPATFATVALLLSATALIACFLAARRATSMDPMQALRCE